MIQILNFGFICCLFLSVESQTSNISPPTNLSVTWNKNFNLSLSWAPPPHSMENCEYELATETKVENSKSWLTLNETSKVISPMLSGGFLKFSVQTICGDRKSAIVSSTTSDPDLVTNLECNIISLKLTRCSWLNATNTPDLRFFFWLKDHFRSYNEQRIPIIQECPSYRDSRGIKTGCDLQAKTTQAMGIYINGTLDGRPVRNTFSSELIVKPSALQWNVTETETDFIISWIPPEVLRSWTLILNYTECKAQKISMEKETTVRLRRVPHCQYGISVKAKAGEAETPWSEVKHFDADTDPNTMVYAAVIIPLVFAGLAAFAFVCFRNNKEKIFPKIPEPRNLLSDISNNNDKGTVRNLYTPEEEEDNCKITLVLDPQTDKLHS